MNDSFGYPIDPKYAGRDPLQELIEEAAPYNISVHAWFEFGFSASVDGNPNSGILDKHPEWAAINYLG